MKLKPVQSVITGERLAKPIYNDQGQILLNSGVKLSGQLLERLKDKGISFVYLEDEATSDIRVKELLDEQTKQKSLKVVHDNFKAVEEKMTAGKTVNLDELSADFSKIVDDILSAVKLNKEAVSMLSEVVAHDSYIFHHSLNVTVYALALGSKLCLNQKELHSLGLGAILHDIGKMGIPFEILNKREPLTDEEFGVIKKHTELGFHMLRKSDTLSLITAHCAYQHHERLDGSGYPRSLTGKDIHSYAKIISIADVFDAVTSNRVYREAMLPHDGLELLYSGAGSLYDKQMVDVFARTVAVYPPGLEVMLSDGRTGVVAETNVSLPARPVIRVLKEADHSKVNYNVDLADELNVTIISC